MSRHLPSFALLASNYPDQPKDTVKRNIGGHINADWIVNTCAIRLSRAFNYSGFPIPSHFHGLNVVSGADGKWYSYRMQELRKWIAFTLGPPSEVRTKSDGKTIDRKDFANRHGVIAFDIHFSDARGHIDLWDGTDFFESRYAVGDYFARATKIVLWDAP
jgi:hypothetical protein